MKIEKTKEKTKREDKRKMEWETNEKKSGKRSIINSIGKKDIIIASIGLLSIVLFISILPYKKSFAVEREGGVSVGAYGSVRLEASKDKTTFILRRIVPTLSASIKDRLKFYTELEFERFGLIELQEELGEKEGELLTKTEVEGLKGSEIKLEQMWGEIEFYRFFRMRLGGILPPVGRFNVLHDDDLWEPARRPLAVRDAPALPIKSAWTEIGGGFLGNFDIGNTLWGYELYVINGATLDHDMEFIVIGGHDEDNKVEEHNHLQLESVIKLRSGNLKEDIKKEKALTGRIFFSPNLGYEVGFSGYFGRYTPSFLPRGNMWSGAVDFKTEISNFLDIEGEYIITGMTNISGVLREIAKKAYQREGEALFTEEITENGVKGVEVEGNVEVESEVKVKEYSLADLRHGGWLLIRFKFFPSFLRKTPFDFGDSKFIFFIRPEIVLYDRAVSSFNFEKGEVKDKDIEYDSPTLFRGTFGIAYRPVQSFVFSISYERTQLLAGEKLIVVKGKPVDAFLFGFSFGL